MNLNNVNKINCQNCNSENVDLDSDGVGFCDDCGARVDAEYWSGDDENQDDDEFFDQDD